MIPTRLSNVECIFKKKVRDSHLDNDKAHVVSRRLGTFLPGYVNVQFVIFRIARVLLRTPMREPGGGKANLIEVADSV